MSSPIEDARAAVLRSDKFQGTAAELPALRDALRALIQHVEDQARAIEGMRDAYGLWDGS